MGLLSLVGHGLTKVGNGVTNAIDRMAYGNLPPELRDNLGVQGTGGTAYPQLAQPVSTPVPEAFPDDPGNQDAVPTVNSGLLAPQATAPPGAMLKPNTMAADPALRKQMRVEFLSSLGAALSSGQPLGMALGSARQNYQQNMVGQLEAVKSLNEQAQQKQYQRMFMQEMQGATTPEAQSAVLIKWAPAIGPKAAQEYGAMLKEIRPAGDESVGTYEGTDPVTGKPATFQRYKSGRVEQVKGVVPKAANIQAGGNGIEYDPVTGMTGAYPMDINGKTTMLRQNMRTGEFFGPDGAKIPVTATITPYKQPTVTPFNQERVYMVQAGGNPDDPSTWTRDVVAKFYSLNKPAAQTNTFNVGAPNSDGTANSLIDAIGNYEVPLTPPRNSSPASMKSYKDIVDALKTSYPKFDAKMYHTAQLTMDAFARGKEAASINAINTAAGHVSVLADAANALQLGDLPTLNKLANALGYQTGSQPLAVYKTIVHRLGPEITKAYVGTGGTLGDRGSSESDFDPALGPKAILSNLGMTAYLFDSKKNALKTQYEKNVPGKNFEGFISPDAQATFDRFKVGGGSGRTAQGGYKINGTYGGRIYLGGNPNSNESWK